MSRYLNVALQLDGNHLGLSEAEARQHVEAVLEEQKQLYGKPLELYCVAPEAGMRPYHYHAGIYCAGRIGSKSRNALCDALRARGPFAAADATSHDNRESLWDHVS
jgi:hypothetical protein